ERGREAKRQALRVDVALQRFELASAEGPTEKLLSDIGQLMCLVDDDRVGARQQLAEAALLEREVGQEQMVIHDHDLRGLRPSPRLENETAIEELTITAEAVVDGRRHGRAQSVIVGKV